MNFKKIEFVAISLLIFFSLCFIVIQPVSAEDDYFFSVTLIAPYNNPMRVQYVQLIAHELPRIGIETKIVYAGWDELIPRMMGSLTHEDYDGGGFDIGFLAWSVSITPVLFYYFHSSQIDPSTWLNNYYPVNNATLDSILEFTMNTTDFDDRKEYVRQALEIIVWGIHPSTCVYEDELVFYMRDNIRGFRPYLLGIRRNWEQETSIEELYFADGHSAGHGQVNELILSSIRQPYGYNPVMVGTEPVGCLAYSPVFSGLLERDADLTWIPGMLTQLPYPVAVKNNYTGQMSTTDPNTATVWEIELRNNLYWHEGYGYNMSAHRNILKIDADDVVWYYGNLIDSNISSPLSYNVQPAFGTEYNKAIAKVDDYRVQFHLYSLYPDLFNLFAGNYYLLPQHILDPTYDAGYGPGVRADGTSAPYYYDWSMDDYHQGTRSSGDINHAATIGSGAYILYPGEDDIQKKVFLTRNPHYYKDNDTLFWKSLVQNRPDKYIYTWNYDNKDSAENALQNGQIDIMDNRYNAERDYRVMKDKPGITVEKELGWSYQSIGYNILNGAGWHLANKWVRLAISHMVPRQYAIDNLLGGLGQPSFVMFPQHSPFWSDSLKSIDYNLTAAIEYMELAGYDMTPYKTPVVEQDDFESTWFSKPDNPPAISKKESIKEDFLLTLPSLFYLAVLGDCVAIGITTVILLFYRHKKVTRNEKE
ncbi:MAG: ABC transporter substrate-binding protein [Candidatus Hermodarchaeota archaeon]